MKCPVCEDKNLFLSNRQGIAINYCSACSGIWLEKVKLEEIIERSINQESTAEIYNPCLPQARDINFFKTKASKNVNLCK